MMSTVSPCSHCNSMIIDDWMYFIFTVQWNGLNLVLWDYMNITRDIYVCSLRAIYSVHILRYINVHIGNYNHLLYIIIKCMS